MDEEELYEYISSTLSDQELSELYEHLKGPFFDTLLWISRLPQYQELSD